MIDYDGRTFRLPGGPDGQARVGHYHQEGDLVWGEFGGVGIRRGLLIGTCAPDGTLEFAYSMVLSGGEVASGRSVCTPSLLDDGRIRLQERFERYGPGGDTGIDYLVEVWP